MDTVLSELQYAERGTGPWRLYIFDNDGTHSGGKWFRAPHEPIKYPDEEISWVDAHTRCMRAAIEHREVRVTDGGDSLVFHSIGGYAMYGWGFWAGLDD